MEPPEPSVDFIVESGRRQLAGPGDVLMHEGDRADRVIVLESGRVKVTVATHRGPTAVLGFRGPGELLGETGALTGQPRSATVTAVEPLVLFTVTAGDFRRHLTEHPAAALALTARLGERLGQSDRRNAEHLTSDTMARVAARIVQLADQFGVDADGRITLPLSQEELAGFSGSSLEAVAKALRSLRAAGWIETGRRELTLRDPDALRRRAAG